MTQSEIFGNAIWLCPKDSDGRIHILRSHFTVKAIKKATLRVIGLGTFHCYLNGKRVSDELFLPLNSEFEERDGMPKGEKLSGFSLYTPEYDVTDMLKIGENLIAVHFGAGWYTYDREGKYGDAKVIFRLFGEDEDGSFDFVSSCADKIGKSFVCGFRDVKPWYSMAAEEEHDYRLGADALDIEFDDGGWDCAVRATAPKTDYKFTDCPADKIVDTVMPTLVYKSEGVKVYDVGKNTTGYPTIKITGKSGEAVRVEFSEELLPTKMPDGKYNHAQSFTAISDGKSRCVHPLFCWYGFRYFAIYGCAEALNVQILHTGVGVTAKFESDNPTLNKIYELFLNTQLTNMHTGIPSDCPHMERRGYTGDGQLICHAAMNVLDAKSFYSKWLDDIRDSQDLISGHIQYTAPYTVSGGGPGGWGCAIVEVPYQLYRHYGDKEPLYRAYPNILRYFDYLEEHSVANLVTSDKEGEWCLGEWCTPREVVLPAPFVNNYFYIKSLQRALTIARLIGKDGDAILFSRRIEERRRALTVAYFNEWDGNFLGGVQAANAFMLDIGLGDGRTYPNLVKRYSELLEFDTGIFGTDILVRVLFERGDGDLAVRLITSNGIHSFSKMIRRGATTLWEYWPDSLTDRSHNHPMFGAAIAYLFDFLAGIREDNGSYTYEKIKIAPVLTDAVSTLSASRVLPMGEVSVFYEKLDTGMHFRIKLPCGASAKFELSGKTRELVPGINEFYI